MAPWAMGCKSADTPRTISSRLSRQSYSHARQPAPFLPARAGRHDSQNTAHLRKIPVDLLFLADILKGPRAVFESLPSRQWRTFAGLRESLFNVLFRPVSKSPFF